MNEIIVYHHVLAEIARPVANTLIEVGQADAVGPCAHPEGNGQTEEGLRSWGQMTPVFETGEWGLDTVEMRPAPDRDGHR